MQQCFDKNGPDGPVTELSPRRLGDFLDTGLRENAALHEKATREEVETRLGKVSARQVSTEVESEPGPREYRGWLTNDVPFGWVKFEIYEPRGKAPARRVFLAVASRSGHGARSEVEESRAGGSLVE